jgi:hypothetical protein
MNFKISVKKELFMESIIQKVINDRDMEITHRKNAGRKNIKANNEIPAKGIHIHWQPQEKMDGNVRWEQA